MKKKICLGSLRCMLVLLALAIAVPMTLVNVIATDNEPSYELNEHINGETVSNGKCGICDDILELESQISRFIEMTSDCQSIESLIYEAQEDVSSTYSCASERNVITVRNVLVYRNRDDVEKGTAATNGAISDGTIVRVFYDNGASWFEYTINPTIPNEAETLSVSSNSHGFVLPIDGMNLTTDLTCQFGCEKDGQLCSWCVSNGFGAIGRVHKGQDISWSGIGGRYIRAVASGEIVVASDSGLGNFASITHSNGLKTVYAHMMADSAVSGWIPQGTVIGQVGNTGLSTANHLHFQVENSSGTPIDPMPYLEGAETYVPYFSVPKYYKIVDGPLTLREQPSTTSTSYGTLPNGTSLTISELQLGNNDFIFGLISSGTYSGKWIAVGTVTGDIYAANLSNVWRVLDGPLTVRETATASASSYGQISNGSSFGITDAVKSGDFIFGKISSSPIPNLNSGSTCSTANAVDHWVAINYCVTD